MALASWLTDARRALLSIARRPAHRVAIVFTLALGLGANAAIFDAGERLHAAAPAVRAPAELTLLELEYRQPDGKIQSFSNWSYPLWQGFVEGTAGALESAAYTPSPVQVNLGGVERATRAGVEIVSGNYFALLGVAAMAGRALGPADDAPEAPAVAVLSERLALAHFGSVDGALARTVRLNDREFQVAGVVAGGFRGLSERAELWVPMASAPLLTFANRLKGKTSFWHRVVTRRPAEEAFEATLGAGARAASGRVPMADAFGAGELEVAARDWLAARRNPALERNLKLLRGAVVFLLLLALLNAAHLAVAAVIERRREQGVRLALGADGARLRRGQWIEMSLLGLASGIAGIAMGAWLGAALLGLLAPGSAARLSDGTWHGLDLRVLALALAAGAIVGAVAASRIARVEPSAALSPVQSSASRLGGWRRGSIGLQALLAVLLLALAGAALSSAEQLRTAPLGFSPEGVLSGRVQVPSRRVDRPDADLVFASLLEGARALPGVTQAAIANCLPLSDACDRTGMKIEGRPVAPGEAQAEAVMDMVSGGYFAAMGIALKQGRAIEDTDRAGSKRVAVISEAAARRYWPDGGALGARIQLAVGWGADDDWAEVVGVAADAPLMRPGENALPLVYLSQWQFSYGENNVVVKTAGDPGTLAAPLADLMRRTDADLPLFDLAPMDARVAAATAVERGLALVSSAFALLALLLAATGVHGVLAFHLSRRTRELGVRAALGASRTRLLSELLRGAGLPALAGIALGVGALALAGPALAERAALPAFDLALLAAAAALVLLALLLAAARPAWRAARVDPMVALRYE